MFGELSKFRLSSLVVMSSGLGYAMGMPSDWSWSSLAVTCGGTFLCAVSANTFNQVLCRGGPSLLLAPSWKRLVHAGLSLCTPRS